MTTAFHAFPPETGLLVRRAVDAMHLDHDGSGRYRLVRRSDGCVEADGSRDDCIAKAELLWWEAEAAPTSVVRYHVQQRAAALEFDRWEAPRRRWKEDPYLTNAVLQAHVLG
ncbi:MAG TPA: hypothetical protein VFC09_13065 [Candidatus Dormibacteraeota bacterium]|nr:hypothetical protein [Candidatus Dormibacteraeota bacterium]